METQFRRIEYFQASGVTKGGANGQLPSSFGAVAIVIFI
ncbi:unnamed protein product, partial [Rotaria magnacalcarata]